MSFAIFGLILHFHHSINNMILYEYYQDAAQRFGQEEKFRMRQNNRYAWLRLFIIVATVVAGIITYSFSPWLSVGTVIAFLMMFAVCLKKHSANIERQHRSGRLKTINLREMDSLEGNWSAFDPGIRYEDPKHDYTSDLDIFGVHSLFRYINRTTSPSGSDMLARWLSGPASTDNIVKRQGAVNEFSEMVDRRQEMQAVGLKYKDIAKEQPGFIEWLHGEAVLSNNRKLLLVMQILPWMTIAAGVSAIAGWIPSAVVWLLVVVHFMISGSTAKKVNYLHQQVSRKVEFIGTYSELINLFIETKFTSPYLTELRNCFVESNATDRIKALQNRIKKLDYRLNMLYIPVNILFFFDYKHLVWLEKWRLGAGQQLTEWFDAIAEAEALASFANLKFNNPGWVMPEIKDDYFTLEAVEVGHPLILEKERVCNDFSLTGEGRVAIVTGSNMSGKSTFERSIGVNMVLALAGAPVCASYFAITTCRLFTYMRIADNLEERTSSFYAELKRLKQLIDITGNGQHVFFLLDEVLRGTNSRDRQIGSVALIRQLVKHRVSGIIATHDLALGELEKELPGYVNNSHFDVQINGEDMLFDYKLHPGICTSLNASVLMRKIGIDVN